MTSAEYQWPLSGKATSPLSLNSQVPYDDLRYLFGEIMYGGHITDDWDRRLCRTYLEEFIKPEMMEGELCLAPSFPLPGNMDYNSYHQVRPTGLRLLFLLIKVIPAANKIQQKGEKAGKKDEFQ